jgi:hypothetical protein
MPQAKPPADLYPGQEFNSWRVLGYAGRKLVGVKSFNHRHYWRCLCKKCHRPQEVWEFHLVKGNSRQCRACANKQPKTHGETQSRTLRRRKNPVYIAWLTLRKKRDPVCPEWLVVEGGEGFKAFAKSVGKKPSPDYQFRRIDPKKPWQPGNVYWAIWRPQGQQTYIYQGQKYTRGELAFLAEIHLSTMAYRLENMSVEDAMTCAVSLHDSGVMEYTAFGETKKLRDWEGDPRMKVNRKTFHLRLKEKWSVEDALSKPPQPVDGSEREYTAFGETKKLRDWETDKRFKVDRTNFFARLGLGWTVEEAMTTRPRKVQRQKKYLAFGKRKTLSEWVKDDRFVVDRKLFHHRVARKWDAERAMSEPTQSEYARSMVNDTSEDRLRLGA